jgi:hypothetical protein
LQAESLGRLRAYAAKAMDSGMIVDKFDNPSNQLINLIPANERITEVADWHSL